MERKENRDWSQECPTLRAGAMRVKYANVVNIGGEENASLATWQAEAIDPKSGSVGWITRTGPIKTYWHVAAETLELARERQGEELDGKARRWDGEEEHFWPVISNEFMAKAFCGEVGAARELMREVEALWASDHAWREEALDWLSENPLQAYLFELEGGLATVHFSFSYEWEGPLSRMEDKLRAKRPDLFEKLDQEFVSNDYFGTYDFYCSASFIEQTSKEMAAAAWRSCVNQEGLASCLENRGGAEAIRGIMAELEAIEIGKSAAEGKKDGIKQRI